MERSPRHPPLQPGWIDLPHLTLALGDFPLESGESIRDFRLSYVVHGLPPEAAATRGALAGRPVALALCAVASTHHRLDFLIGPGRALDPGRMVVVVADAIGNGLTTSPSNSTLQPGSAFPTFGIRDMVASQAALLDHLGVGRLEAVVGASMGGMQALQWAVSHRERIGRVVAMTPMARTSPWAAAINEASRRALLRTRAVDAAVAANDDADAWAAWVPLMQLLSARTPAQVHAGFESAADVIAWIEDRTRWWRVQGFAPVDWIYQSRAYDAHDVGGTPGFGGDTAAALQSVTAPTLVLAPALDLYNPVEAARYAADRIPGGRFVEIPSAWGHQSASAADPGADAFLNRVIAEFLAASPR